MNKEYYWSLIIESDWIQAAIWIIEEKLVQIVSISSPSSWEGEEDLIGVADTTLSAAISDFPEEEREPSKTVFGVPSSWVTEGQIKKDHLGLIRKICSKLSLKPSGFVVLPEAIAHAIKIEEGSPLTGVIVGAGRSGIEVTVFRLGNLVGTISVGRSVSIVDDVIEGLTRFAGKEALPSRFLLYDGKEAELAEVKEALVKADWENMGSNKFQFLHTPQVEIINPEKKVVAVSLAGASEVGEIQGFSLKKREKEKEVEPETKDERHKITVEEVLEPKEAPSVEDMGFVLDKDIQDLGPAPVEKEAVKSKEPRLKMGIKFPRFTRKRNISLPSGKLPGGFVKRLALLGMVFLVLAAVGLTVAWWFISKAEVAIYVSPKTLEEIEIITFDQSAGGIDLENMLVPASMIERQVDGSKTRSATGTKTVGEKARGLASVRNGTSSSIKLAGGTVILGPNDLKFVLDETASVSAATSPSTPGSITVSVTAGDIGAEHNLAKGEIFKVENYPKSEVDGITEEDFSGGLSREVVVVSDDDLEKLEEELSEELVQKGEQEIAKDISKEEVFIGDTVSSKVIKKEFNHKSGDEASSVKLELVMGIDGLVASRTSLNELALEILSSKVPEGFSLREDQTNINFSVDEEEEEGVFIIETTFIANLLPKVDPDEITRQIAGKKPLEAQKYLEKIPGYSFAEVRVRPSLPGILGNIPRNLNNISIELVAER